MSSACHNSSCYLELGMLFETPADKAILDLLAVHTKTLARIEANQAVILKQWAAATTQEKTDMSVITDWAAKENANLTAISGQLNTITSGVAALDAAIVAFQNSPGTLSAPDQAALDAIVAQSAALVTAAGAINTAVPGTTPPPPAPAKGTP